MLLAEEEDDAVLARSILRQGEFDNKQAISRKLYDNQCQV